MKYFILIMVCAIAFASYTSYSTQSNNPPRINDNIVCRYELVTDFSGGEVVVERSYHYDAPNGNNLFKVYPYSPHGHTMPDQVIYCYNK